MTDPYMDGYNNPYGPVQYNQSAADRINHQWGQQDAQRHAREAQTREAQNADYGSSSAADGYATARAAHYQYQQEHAKEQRERAKLAEADKTKFTLDGKYGVPFTEFLAEGDCHIINKYSYADGLSSFFNVLSAGVRSDFPAEVRRGFRQTFEECHNNPSRYFPFNALRPYHPLERMMDGFMRRPEPSKSEHVGARWCYVRGRKLGDRYIALKLEQIESRKSLLHRVFNWKTQPEFPGETFLYFYRHFMFPEVNEVYPRGLRLQHQHIDPMDAKAYKTDRKYREFVDLRNFGLR